MPPESSSTDPPFLEDELSGYEALKFALPPENDGPLWATLVRKRSTEDAASSASRPAVLYVHGYCDYFFQTHLCDAIEAAGYRFYALDLRRYGRSLAQGNRANQARDISDYFPELNWATQFILKRHSQLAAMIAHSTGGLILSHFLKSSQHTQSVGCLVLNSPFLKFNLKKRQNLLVALVARVGRWLPYQQIHQKISGIYGKTLHISEAGEWDYNLNYKPIFSFPFYPMWFRMIIKAQAEALRGLELPLPILAMRSSQSRFPSTSLDPLDFVSDTVLSVQHIRDLAPRLGPHVFDCVIENGLHDLFLSKEASRNLAMQQAIEFIRQYTQS